MSHQPAADDDPAIEEEDGDSADEFEDHPLFQPIEAPAANAPSDDLRAVCRRYRYCHDLVC